MWEFLFMTFCGLAFGFLSSAGVLTVFSSVSLVPRYAAKTGTQRHSFLYEECLILGALAGCIGSVFELKWGIGEHLISSMLLGVGGFFAGIFVGCLAMSIAEMLDSIPIFASRIKLKEGMSLVLLAVAMGKLTGSLLYFYNGIYQFSKG
ncbi:MAG: stage V sporulation protein AB [Lachnospiraceae bacterium]|nr:stage V sporulation protein AB [Lachnospiraceae bacterium]